MRMIGTAGCGLRRRRAEAIGSCKGEQEKLLVERRSTLNSCGEARLMRQ